MTSKIQYLKYKTQKILPDESKYCDWCGTKITDGTSVSDLNKKRTNICWKCMEKGEKKVFNSLRRNYVWFGLLIIFYIAVSIGIVMRISSEKPLSGMNWFWISVIVLVIFFALRNSYKNIKAFSFLKNLRTADMEAYNREILFGHKIWYYHSMKAINRDIFFVMVNDLKSMTERQKNIKEYQEQLREQRKGTETSFANFMDEFSRQADVVSPIPKWRCPECRAVLVKPGLGIAFFPGESISKIHGQGSCPSCKKSFPAADIYGGKYDKW